jgi:hypothetical protein
MTRMIHVGIDDTDTPGTPGTNQLARRLAAALPTGFALVAALRHQLLIDPRIPYTSQNGCASLLIRAEPDRSVRELVPLFREVIREWFVAGSDPGLCVADDVPGDVVTFGRRAQQEVLRQADARSLARRHGLHLEGLGGTDDGVIGALAAVGLLASQDDGRVVHRAPWQWPDPFAGVQSVADVLGRGVDEVLDAATGRSIREGQVDVGKHLRPSYRAGRFVLFVEPTGPGDDERWRAMKLP